MELNTKVYVAGVTQKVAGGQLGVADSQVDLPQPSSDGRKNSKTSIGAPLVSLPVTCCSWYHPIRFAFWPKSTDGTRYRFQIWNESS
jgi:hypothetical protein